MALNEPLAQHDLPGKTVRRHPPVVAELCTGGHIKAALTHYLRQRLDLAGESGRELPYVVGTGKPHSQVSAVD